MLLRRSEVLWQNHSKQLNKLRIVILAFPLPLGSTHVCHLYKKANDHIIQFLVVFPCDQAALNKVNVLIGVKEIWVENAFEIASFILVHGPPDHHGLESIIYLNAVDILKYAAQ